MTGEQFIKSISYVISVHNNKVHSGIMLNLTWNKALRPVGAHHPVPRVARPTLLQLSHIPQQIGDDLRVISGNVAFLPGIGLDVEQHQLRSLPPGVVL